MVFDGLNFFSGLFFVSKKDNEKKTISHVFFAADFFGDGLRKKIWKTNTTNFPPHFFASGFFFSGALCCFFKRRFRNEFRILLLLGSSANGLLKNSKFQRLLTSSQQPFESELNKILDATFEISLLFRSPFKQKWEIKSSTKISSHFFSTALLKKSQQTFNHKNVVSLLLRSPWNTHSKTATKQTGLHLTSSEEPWKKHNQRKNFRLQHSYFVSFFFSGAAALKNIFQTTSSTSDFFSLLLRSPSKQKRQITPQKCKISLLLGSSNPEKHPLNHFHPKLFFSHFFSGVLQNTNVKSLSKHSKSHFFFSGAAALQIVLSN